MDTTNDKSVIQIASILKYDLDIIGIAETHLRDDTIPHLFMCDDDAVQKVNSLFDELDGEIAIENMNDVYSKFCQEVHRNMALFHHNNYAYSNIQYKQTKKKRKQIL